jgi:CNT family concentrative nucleoside transporter
MQSLQSALGVVAIVAIAFIVSENRRAVPWRPVIVGLVVTFALALLMLKVPQTEIVFGWVNRAVEAIAAATRAGTSFVFGYVGGGALPFDPKSPGSDFILAFQALPVVLVMSVLSSLLFYWRVLPPIVRGFSWALERTLDVGGAAGLSTAANIFVGQVEAPLFIRPYLDKLSRSEMFIVMTGGMAGIAGTVFVLYATILVHAIPDAAGHIAVCSVLGAPAAIVISLLMVPDPNRRHTGGQFDDVKQTTSGTWTPLCEARARGLSFSSTSSPC